MHANLSISASARILQLSVIGVIAVVTPSVSASVIVVFVDDVTAGACSRREGHIELDVFGVVAICWCQGCPTEKFRGVRVLVDHVAWCWR